MRRIAMALIRAYQHTLSPDHGPLRHLYPFGFCRFTPTCSSYGHDALKIHGFFIGSWLAVKRILRCHPWSEGGSDPVPLIKKP